MNSRPCWQLYATGNSVNGWKFKLRSKQIFTERKEAVDFIPQFREKCIDPSHFESAEDDESLRIEVVELELLG